MREELNEEVVPGNLCWLVENFYTYDVTEYHELCYYYNCSLKAGSLLLSREKWSGRDGDLALTFRWVGPQELAGLTVYPSFVVEKAFTPGVEKGEIEHFVWRE
jgi:hypothetical protein